MELSRMIVIQTTVHILFTNEEHSRQFQHLILPPKSSDMNHLVHIWDMIERAVRAKVSALIITMQLFTVIEATKHLF